MNTSDIAERRFELVQHSRYSPDLATLEWDLFPKMKKGLGFWLLLP